VGKNSKNNSVRPQLYVAAAIYVLLAHNYTFGTPLAYYAATLMRLYHKFVIFQSKSFWRKPNAILKRNGKIQLV